MKRSISKVLSIVLMLALVLTLAGCGEQSKFVGKWEAKLDLSDLMNKQMGENAAMADYIKIDDFIMVLELEFEDDGTYKMSVDEDEFADSIDSIKDDLKDGLTDYFEDYIKGMGVQMSVEDVLKQSGTDLDTLVEDALSEETIEGITGEMEKEGNYEVKDGKLFLSDGKDKDIDEDVYTKYEISDDELKLTESSDEEEADLYPMTFKKK